MISFSIHNVYGKIRRKLWAVMIPIVLCYELGGNEFAATFEVINMRRCSGKPGSCKLRYINTIRSTPKEHRHQGLGNSLN